MTLIHSSKDEVVPNNVIKFKVIPNYILDNEVVSEHVEERTVKDGKVLLPKALYFGMMFKNSNQSNVLHFADHLEDEEVQDDIFSEVLILTDCYFSGAKILKC